MNDSQDGPVRLTLSCKVRADKYIDSCLISTQQSGSYLLDTRANVSRTKPGFL